ncbi:YqzL family protein [Hazenella coriacea]|nr:YqzL family protein [Hazenella coriacea]
MRNFVWSCFQVTGSIEAYLLYKECEAISRHECNSEHQDVKEEESLQ